MGFCWLLSICVEKLYCFGKFHTKWVKIKTCSWDIFWLHNNKRPFVQKLRKNLTHFRWNASIFVLIHFSNRKNRKKYNHRNWYDLIGVLHVDFLFCTCRIFFREWGKNKLETIINITVCELQSPCVCATEATSRKQTIFIIITLLFL